MGIKELADEVYEDPQASGLVGDGGNWYLEVIGGIPRYVRMNLKQLKKMRDDSHPDRPGGSHEKFLIANERYLKALERTKSK